MNPQTALQTLDNVVAEVKMTRQDHFTAMQAVETLQRSIHDNEALTAEKQEAEKAAAEAAALAEAEQNAAGEGSDAGAGAALKQPAKPRRRR